MSLSEARKRPVVGLMGGRFDPIHYGHLRMALELKQTLSLTEMRLLPSALPPHKSAQCRAADRLAMVKLAVYHCAELSVDEREFARTGPSYTVDTLCSIREDLGGDTSLLWVMGWDAFTQFDQWHQWQDILTLAHVVVLARPGKAAALPKVLQVLIDRDDNVDQIYTQASGAVVPLNLSQLAISSTLIRQLLAKGHSPKFLLPDRVLQHIVDNGWYQ